MLGLLVDVRVLHVVIDTPGSAGQRIPHRQLLHDRRAQRHALVSGMKIMSKLGLILPSAVSSVTKGGPEMTSAKTEAVW